jgi:hypothetical protein
MTGTHHDNVIFYWESIHLDTYPSAEKLKMKAPRCKEGSGACFGRVKREGFVPRGTNGGLECQRLHPKEE